MEKPSIHAVVPMKALAQAKSRLAGALPPAKRQALAREMLGRVLRLLQQVQTPDGPLEASWLISADPAVLALAPHYAAQPLLETTIALNAALEQARDKLRAAGASHMLILPADVPLVREEDLLAMIAGLPKADLVIAPDQAEQGTNALALDLAVEFPFCFGIGSLALHLGAARERGLRVEFVRSPTLAFDVDTPQGYLNYRTG